MHAASGLPVIDLAGMDADSATARSRIAEQIRDACEQVGFFYIANHGVPADLVRRVFAENDRFNALPPEDKLGVALSRHHRGYQALGGSTLKLSTVESAYFANQSESFFMRHEMASSAGGRCPIDGPNQWPTALPGFREGLLEYHEALEALCQNLVAPLAVALGEPPEAFRRQYFSRPATALRLLHYPPRPADSPSGAFGIAPHTDYGFLTILAQDHAGGLEIRSSGGEWMPVTPLPDTFVVNIGDALSRMTNHRFRSTAHRVINPSPTESRYSVPFFFDPCLDATVGCLTDFVTNADPVVPVRYGDYLLERLDANFELT